MSAPRRVAWLAALALACLALAFPPPRAAGRAPLLLLSPFAELAAQVQWLRFHVATRRGEEARALALAESALALDPRASDGWEALAAHLALDLASREREPDLARRCAWFEAGLAALARGAERAARPAELELYRALLLANKAELDPELHPRGAAGLAEDSLAALERAAALGDERALELLPQARAAARE